MQTSWKWSNWRLTREQDGTNVSLISHIHVLFLSCVIRFIVLPTLPSPSSAVFLKFPITSHDTFGLLRIYFCDYLFFSYITCEPGNAVLVDLCGNSNMFLTGLAAALAITHIVFDMRHFIFSYPRHLISLLFHRAFQNHVKQEE